MREFAEQYYSQIKLAQEDPNLDAFKHFLYNSSGSILIDEELNLEPFPLLKRIYQTDGAQYKVYKFDPAKDKKELEMNAIDEFTASFSQGFTDQQLEALESMKQKPIFNLTKVSKRWAQLSGQKIEAIQEGLKFNWEKYLAPIVVPTRQILICDSYLTTNLTKIKNNLLPILRALRSLIHFRGQVTLISTSSNVSQIQNLLYNEFGEALEFRFAIVESTAIRTEHDRRLVTDTNMLNFPGGFDIINNHGVVTEGKATEPINKSLFSGDIEHQETHARLSSSLYALSDRISSRRTVTN